MGPLSKFRVAIVSDQLATAGGAGGAERVLSALKKIFPQADVYAVVYNPSRMPEEFEQFNIRTTFIQKLPSGSTRYQRYLPLMPLAIESLDLRDYDIVVSSSHSVAKGVLTSPTTFHVCYCHSPMRYAWDKYHEYMELEKAGVVKRTLIAVVMNYLRLWDASSAARVDTFITNSHFDAKRIRKYYQRESHVIHPPCNLHNFYLSTKVENFFLLVGRMVGYKRLDLAIQAFNALGEELFIIGDGADRRKLEKMAGSTIRFLGRVDDNVLAEHYSKCRALIFPGEEDFGIVPVEAQASGRPVIAFGSGGALETVKGVFADRIQDFDDSCTGVFFRRQTVESLIEAVKCFQENQKFFVPANIRKNGQSFSEELFIANVISYIIENYAKFVER